MKKIFYLVLFFTFQFVFSQSNTSSDNVTSQPESIKKRLAGIVNDNYIDSRKKEKILLQLKAESEKINYDFGILQSGKSLMTLYLGSRNKEAVELGTELKKIASSNKDPSNNNVITGIYQTNALALGYLGLDDASLKDFKTAIKYAGMVEDNDIKYYLQSTCYENITVYYINKQVSKPKLRDSTLYYITKSLEAANLIKDYNSKVSHELKYDKIAFSKMRMGIFYLEIFETKGSIEKAEKYLLESLKIYEDKKYTMPPSNKTMILNQMSWLYMEKKEYQKSIDFANRALALEKQYRDPDHRVESFEFLATSYLELGEKEKSKSYMRDYSFLKDSIAYAGKNTADTVMKKMVANVDEEHQESSKKQLMIVGVLFLIALIVTVILWRRKNKILRRNYEQIIEKLKKESISKSADTIADNEEPDDHKEIGNEANEDSELSANKNIFSAETEARILKRLVAFERSDRFTKKDFTISLLATQLNTNNRYLSEVIRNNRSQNFSNYLNHLRINYIVRKLYNEPKYREYKISYLAEECGYASPQVFVIAFKKINGVTPSYFIDSLKEDTTLAYS